MKIAKFAKLVKNSGYCYVAHVAGSGIWLGTNVAMYRATELPEMEGRDQVRTVLDMSEKEFRTIHLVEIWPDGLGNVSGMNLSAYDREQETEGANGSDGNLVRLPPVQRGRRAVFLPRRAAFAVDGRDQKERLRVVHRAQEQKREPVHGGA